MSAPPTTRPATAPDEALDFEALLNPEQLAAVTHGEGPQLVIAGAGSGKTRVITFRIAWLVREKGVDPKAITAVTFTNKAAAEMRQRVEELLGVVPLPGFVGTFHRYALGLLRRYGDRLGLARGFAIVDAADQRALVKKAIVAEGLSETAFPPAAMAAAISSAKNRLLTAADYERQAEDFFQRRVAPVYRRYQQQLHQASGIDFDDMIALAVRLLETDEQVAAWARRRARYLLVDEYQDTNHAQLRLIRALAASEANLTAVGDEDQGIYRWRGAELENILAFEDSFPGAVVRKLERNYRSTQNILDAAGAVVAHNEQRRGKKLWTDAGAGEPIELYRAHDEGDEARWIVNTLIGLEGRYRRGEMAILVRTNAQTRALEEELLRQGVPYRLVGGVRFYERAEVKDLVAYLRLLRNPHDELSLQRVINKPPRGIGKTTVAGLRRIADELGQPLWDVIYHDELGGLPARSATAVRRFRSLVLALQKSAAELPLADLIEELLRVTDYLALYPEGEPENEARRENVRELLSAAREFSDAEPEGNDEEQLTAFLDHASLMSDLDGVAEGGVLVMTLHSAKGLEFEVVVVAGLEDGLLPHHNAQAGDDLEEERRLLYVGMTRARQRLLLTTSRRRRMAGTYQDRQESPFLTEVPAELLTVSASPSLFAGPQRRDVYGFFGRGGRSSGGAGAGGPARPGSAGSGPRRSPLAESTVGGIGRGSRVRHAIMGEGTVLDLDGSGDNAKLTVFFDRAGKKKLVAKYAKLEVL